MKQKSSKMKFPILLKSIDNLLYTQNQESLEHNYVKKSDILTHVRPKITLFLAFCQNGALYGKKILKISEKWPKRAKYETNLGQIWQFFNFPKKSKTVTFYLQILCFVQQVRCWVSREFTKRKNLSDIRNTFLMIAVLILSTSVYLSLKPSIKKDTIFILNPSPSSL